MAWACQNGSYTLLCQSDSVTTLVCPRYTALLSRYTACARPSGTLQTLQQQTTPIFRRPHCIPFAIKRQIREGLDSRHWRIMLVIMLCLFVLVGSAVLCLHWLTDTWHLSMSTSHKKNCHRWVSRKFRRRRWDRACSPRFLSPANHCWMFLNQLKRLIYRQRGRMRSLEAPVRERERALFLTRQTPGTLPQEMV